MTERTVIAGGPRCGKSWLARQLATETGAPRFCGDPKSKVKDVFGGVTYLPEDVPIADSYPGADDGAAAWIAENWFTMPGPWICEGWVMARALRRWMRKYGNVEFEATFPCDRVIMFPNQRKDQELKLGQVTMHKGVETVWRDIRDYYDSITEFRT